MQPAAVEHKIKHLKCIYRDYTLQNDPNRAKAINHNKQCDSPHSLCTVLFPYLACLCWNVVGVLAIKFTTHIHGSGAKVRAAQQSHLQ